MKRLILSFLLCFSIACKVTPACNTAGDTNIEGNTATFGFITANAITVTGPKVCSQIVVYTDNVADQMDVAVYQSSAGTISTMLTNSGSVLVSQTGWVTIGFPQVTLSTGVYWLAFQTQVLPNLRYGVGGIRVAQTASTFGAWPNMAGTEFVTQLNLSIYALVCDPSHYHMALIGVGK